MYLSNERLLKAPFVHQMQNKIYSIPQVLVFHGSSCLSLRVACRSNWGQTGILMNPLGKGIPEPLAVVVLGDTLPQVCNESGLWFIPHKCLF